MSAVADSVGISARSAGKVVARRWSQAGTVFASDSDKLAKKAAEIRQGQTIFSEEL